MSCTPWGQVAIELDWIFHFWQISIGLGTWTLKKTLKTRSNLTPPFKPLVKKKLTLKVSIIYVDHKPNESIIWQPGHKVCITFYSQKRPRWLRTVLLPEKGCCCKLIEPIPTYIWSNLFLMCLRLMYLGTVIIIVNKVFITFPEQYFSELWVTNIKLTQG